MPRSESRTRMRTSAVAVLCLLMSSERFADAFTFVGKYIRNQHQYHSSHTISPVSEWSMHSSSLYSSVSPADDDVSNSAGDATLGASNDSSTVPQSSLPDQPSSRTSPFGPRSSLSSSAFSDRGSVFRTESSATSYSGALDGVGGLVPLESNPPSPRRLDRMKKEAELKSKYLNGDQLVQLRKYVDNILVDLGDATRKGEEQHIRTLTKALRDAREMDAEYVYQVCKENSAVADSRGESDESKRWMKEALDARACMPQFNLEGLWVGKYGEHGYEMINITYVGDMLIATKVTGDKNVPKGQVSFTADLGPPVPQKQELKPIELSDVASKQWGQKYLPRFPGKGQVAAEGFKNNQWMEGQLILVGEYFSFAWLPIGHQIFFGRPSAELTMKMLKQSRMVSYGAFTSSGSTVLAEMRSFVQQCFDETELLLDDECGIEGALIFSREDQNYLIQENCFQ